jgi:glycosyltransferase 2 family protein
VSDTATQRAPLWRRIVLGWPLRVLVLSLIAGLIAWRVDFRPAVDAFKQQGWWNLGIAVLANFMSVVMKGVAWRGVVQGLEALKGIKLRLVDVVSPILVGFLFNTVLAARLGEFVKVLLLKRRLATRDRDVPVTLLLGTVVAENLATTITWVVVAVGIGAFLPLPRWIWLSTLSIGVAALAIVLVAMLKAPRGPVPGWMNTGTFWARATRTLRRLWGAVSEGNKSLKDPRRAAEVGFGGITSAIFQWVGIFFVLRAFGLSAVGWGGAGLLLITVTLAQVFPVLPANVGIFQAAVVTPLIATYDVDTATATAFSVVLQFTEIIVGVAIGFIFLMTEGVGFKELRRQAEDHD